MNDGHGGTVPCQVCCEERPSWEMIPGSAISQPLSDMLSKRYPGWETEDMVCASCLAQARQDFLTHVLESEREETLAEDRELDESLRAFQLSPTNIGEEITRHRTPGERVADDVAAFVGSWTFVVAQIVFLIIWVIFNSVAIFVWHFDPYPFIFLNLVISWLAALENPLIMMSQNRQNDRDRLRDSHDYHVNLAAELEIRHLHRKLDQLLTHNWPQLVEIQRMQMELMERITRSLPPEQHGKEE